MFWYQCEMGDFQFVTRQLAIGGAIWTSENMREVARAGISHVVNMQIEFDDSSICDGAEVFVHSNGCDDDFLPKPPEFFRKTVQFTLQALADPQAKILFHCAAGIHRSAFMLLAVLRILGYDADEAIALMQAARPQVDFPPVYLESVEDFVRYYETSKSSGGADYARSGFPEAAPTASEV
ncbi:MAG: dual specificity protein phosphatase family protein [Acidobacteria bacterium]|nr:dual specificity protein phosphatase family protein [Acidobacteriota bacterium]